MPCPYLVAGRRFHLDDVVTELCLYRRTDLPGPQREGRLLKRRDHSSAREITQVTAIFPASHVARILLRQCREIFAFAQTFNDRVRLGLDLRVAIVGGFDCQQNMADTHQRRKPVLIQRDIILNVLERHFDLFAQAYVHPLPQKILSKLLAILFAKIPFRYTAFGKLAGKRLFAMFRLEFPDAGPDRTFDDFLVHLDAVLFRPGQQEFFLDHVPQNKLEHLTDPIRREILPAQPLLHGNQRHVRHHVRTQYDLIVHHRHDLIEELWLRRGAGRAHQHQSRHNGATHTFWKACNHHVWSPNARIVPMALTAMP